MRTAIQSFFILLLALLCGCYETTFFLDKAEDATLDESLFGHWVFDASGPDAKDGSTLDVSKFDDHRYQFDWTMQADGKVMKMAGHTATVKDALFIHAAERKDDGTLAEKHFIIRIDRDGSDTITISNLDPDFFKDKKIDSGESLRATIEANLADPKLYVTDVLVGKRAK